MICNSKSLKEFSFPTRISQPHSAKMPRLLIFNSRCYRWKLWIDQSSKNLSENLNWTAQKELSSLSSRALNLLGYAKTLKIQAKLMIMKNMNRISKDVPKLKNLSLAKLRPEEIRIMLFLIKNTNKVPKSIKMTLKTLRELPTKKALQWTTLLSKKAEIMFNILKVRLTKK
jgi:hypothetical protein